MGHAHMVYATTRQGPAELSEELHLLFMSPASGHWEERHSTGRGAENDHQVHRTSAQLPAGKASSLRGPDGHLCKDGVDTGLSFYLPFLETSAPLSSFCASSILSEGNKKEKAYINDNK